MEDLAAFTDRAHAFLAANAARRDPDERQEWGEGDDTLSNYTRRSHDDEVRRVAAARAWMNAEFDAGFGWIRGPVDAGGAGLTADHERAYHLARREYDVPDLSAYVISLGMVAPTFHHWGSEVVRDRYVRKLYRGDLLGCQMFSEPEAGSDVASLKTQAVRDGDVWRVNGQKVWTSVAHLADCALLLTRTDPDKPKHKGITAFALDMSLPGIEVRPLVMATGGTEFNEIFFDDVLIPDTHRLGDVDEGWTVAIFTLMNERALGAGASGGGNERLYERLRMQARRAGFDGADPVLVQELAGIHTDLSIIGWLGMRADARRNAGLPPGPEESMFKLLNTNLQQRIGKAATRLTGMALTADTGAWGTYAWADQIMTTAGARIAAGTDEIMKNILAERVLGLPKEPGHQR